MPVLQKVKLLQSMLLQKVAQMPVLQRVKLVQ